MTAGNTSVQIATTGTAAAIKTAVDAAITATGTAARLTICQLNNGAVVVVANLIA